MRVCQNSLEMIGRTPIQILNRLHNKKPEIWAKMEYLSPGSSVKDRLAAYLVNEAIENNKIKPGGTFIEATAGNTGIGLAVACAAAGYKFICVMPQKYSMEKQQIIEFLGSTVVRTPQYEGMQGAMQKALDLEKEIPNSLALRQYENPSNPECHYRFTGPEIWEQTAGKVTHFITGAGTGGTFTGVARFLKEKNPNIKTYIVEGEGSILGGGKPGPHWVEGIGSDFWPGALDMSLSDGVFTVSDADSRRMVRNLALEEQILAGGSGGAHVHAALQLAKTCHPTDLIVTLICDRLERYISKGILEPVD
jgi:O-acetylserine dependent cystathionine beta-synthase